MDFSDTIIKHLSQGGTQAVKEWIGGELTKLTLRDGVTEVFYSRTDFNNFVRRAVRTHQYKLIFLLLDSGIPSLVICKLISEDSYLLTEQNRPLVQRLQVELRETIRKHELKRLELLVLEGEEKRAYLLANISKLSDREIIEYGLDWRTHVSKDILLAEFPEQARQKYSKEEITSWLVEKDKFYSIEKYPEVAVEVKAGFDARVWSPVTPNLDNYVQQYGKLPPFMQLGGREILCISYYNFDTTRFKLIIADKELFSRCKGNIVVEWERFFNQDKQPYWASIVRLLALGLWPHSHMNLSLEDAHRTKSNKTIASQWQEILSNYSKILELCTKGNLQVNILETFHHYYSNLTPQLQTVFQNYFFNGTLETTVLQWFLTTCPVTVQQYYSSTTCATQSFEAIHAAFKPNRKQVSIALRMALEKRQFGVATFLIKQGAELSKEHINGVVTCNNKELLEAYLSTNPPVSEEIIRAAIKDYALVISEYHVSSCFERLHTYCKWPEEAEKRLEDVIGLLA